MYCDIGFHPLSADGLGRQHAYYTTTWDVRPTTLKNFLKKCKILLAKSKQIVYNQLR